MILILDYCIEFLFCLIDTLLLHGLAVIFMDRKDKNAFYSGSIAFITALISHFITYERETNALVTLGLFAIYLIYLALLFKGNLKQYFSLDTLYFVGTGVITLASSLLVSTLVQISLPDLLHLVYVRYATMALIKLLTFFAIYLCSNIMRKRRIPIRLYGLRLFMFLVLIALIVLYEVAYSDKILSLRNYTITLFLSFALISVASFVLYIRFITVQTELNEIKIKDSLLIHDMKSQTEISQLRHDLKHHMTIIHTMLRQNKSEDALNYLDNYLKLPSLKGFVQTNNPYINAICNQTMNQHPDIHLVVHHDRQDYAIDAEAIGIIFGNALNNAIEATKHCPEDKRAIWLMLSENEHYIKFSFKNYYQHQLMIRQGEYVSTKNSGYGLKSIKKIVEKYNGTLDIETEENTFILRTIFKKDKI